MRLADIFHASRARRWHTNAHMSHTVDPLDGHHGRVARILLHLWPDSTAAILRAALTHDDGEHAFADVAGPDKRNMDPALLAAVERIMTEARVGLWGDDPDLTDIERDRLDFADKLDALMWVAHHRPERLKTTDWESTHHTLMVQARALGVWSHVVAIRECLTS